MSISAFIAKIGRPVHHEHRRLQRKMAKAGLQKQTIQVPNGSLGIWVGDGPADRPLVLLQGFGGTATWQWHRQVRTLAKRYRLYLPNLLYFGDSQSTQADYSVEHQADTVRQVMDQLGVDTFDLGGLSYGGLVALKFAVDYGERVKKLVITSSPGPVMTHQDLDQALARLQAAHIEELFLPDGPEAVHRLIKLAWHRPPWTPRFALLDAHPQLFTTQVEAKRHLLRHLMDRIGNAEIMARNITHETLLLWGAHDPVFPVDIGRRLSAHLGTTASLRVIDSAAHCPNLERPKEWNDTVLAFLGT